MRFKERIIARKKMIEKLNNEESFCFIIGEICNREKCDVYPCDGSIAFYNVPTKLLKKRNNND